MIARSLFALICTLMLVAQVQAHSLYFTLRPEFDNHIELEAVFSNGQTPAGVTVRIYDKNTDTIIWQGKTDEFGTCLFERPDSSYDVELDAGPGHQTRQSGL